MFRSPYFQEAFGLVNNELEKLELPTDENIMGIFIRHGLRGFVAKLTDKTESKVAGEFDIVSVSKEKHVVMGTFMINSYRRGSQFNDLSFRPPRGKEDDTPQIEDVSGRFFSKLITLCQTAYQEGCYPRFVLLESGDPEIEKGNPETEF